MIGAGQLVMASENPSYSGNMIIMGGTLDTFAATSLGTGALTLDDNVTFDLPGSTTFANKIEIDGNSEFYLFNGSSAFSGAIANGAGVGAVTLSAGGGGGAAESVTAPTPAPLAIAPETHLER